MLPHLDAAHNLARWLVRDRAAAEDVVQTAYLRALTYFPSFRGGNARAWLLQIVRNTAYAWLVERGPTTTPLDCDTLGIAGDDDPEAALLHDEERRHLAELLAGLPAELRECLVLREIEEMSYRDIATVTGAPIGTVMSRLWRARRLLLAAARQEPAA
ncbi:MAG: sigma-70 family RNA polymerase sigma factor [Rhodospirillales bacterium]|nr:sigma-70 family RNA polymerase sigma factor [Rhodospirillales bacterium]MDE2575564.1 sigma-70 family RNA polymerase sigma factor [Rhodospirillales bacterium]